jgi:FAD/FMN-containing dehydrogenase
MGESAAIASADVGARHLGSDAEQLAASLRGELLRPGAGGYDEARRIWNAMIDRRPAFIVRCAGPADVVRSINFARYHGLTLSVRGGGHNVSGNAVCESGLMVDLSGMKGIRVGPARSTVRAEAGCTWRDFDHETQAFGLATTGGVVSMTGIAGLTLGGGLGWLMRKHGLACDNLLSLDMVTADGRLLTASATENADLFWAARGGGGNFGVVTSFEYRLHPVGQVLGGMVAHPLDRARDVLRFLREFAASAPSDLGTMAAFVTGQDGTRLLALFVCYSGPLAGGERVLRPLRAFGPPLADEITAMPYLRLQSLLDAGFPAGLQNYWKSSFLRHLSDEAIDILIDGFRKVPSPTSAMAIEQLGGAVAEIADDDTAFAHRRAPFNLLIVGIWPDPADSPKHIDWVRQLWEAMQPHATGGVYVNYLGQEADEGRERVRAAYGREKYERLLALKRKYDPDNVFRFNQNIDPKEGQP